MKPKMMKSKRKFPAYAAGKFAPPTGGDMHMRQEGFGCGGKVKMASGGAVCRGGGAAKRGLKFGGVK